MIFHLSQRLNITVSYPSFSVSLPSVMVDVMVILEVEVCYLHEIGSDVSIVEVVQVDVIVILEVEVCYLHEIGSDVSIVEVDVMVILEVEVCYLHEIDSDISNLGDCLHLVVQGLYARLQLGKKVAKECSVPISVVK